MALAQSRPRWAKGARKTRSARGFEQKFPAQRADARLTNVALSARTSIPARAANRRPTPPGSRCKETTSPARRRPPERRWGGRAGSQVLRPSTIRHTCLLSDGQAPVDAHFFNTLRIGAALRSHSQTTLADRHPDSSGKVAISRFRRSPADRSRPIAFLPFDYCWVPASRQGQGDHQIRRSGSSGGSMQPIVANHLLSTSPSSYSR